MADTDKAELVRQIRSEQGLKSPLLMDADLSGSDLSGVTLNQVFFLQVDLSSANLTNAKISSSMFTSCNLDGADLSQATLEEVVFTMEYAPKIDPAQPGVPLEEAGLGEDVTKALRDQGVTEMVRAPMI